MVVEILERCFAEAALNSDADAVAADVPAATACTGSARGSS